MSTAPTSGWQDNAWFNQASGDTDITNLMKWMPEFNASNTVDWASLGWDGPTQNQGLGEDSGSMTGMNSGFADWLTANGYTPGAAPNLDGTGAGWMGIMDRNGNVLDGSQYYNTNDDKAFWNAMMLAAGVVTGGVATAAGATGAAAGAYSGAVTGFGNTGTAQGALTGAATGYIGGGGLGQVSGTGSTIADAALTKAMTSGAIAGVQGNSIGDAALAGGISGGLGSLASNIPGVSPTMDPTLSQAINKAISAGVGTAVQGGNLSDALTQAAIAGGSNALVNTVLPDDYAGSGKVNGAISGALGSVLQGQDPNYGKLINGLVSGYNAYNNPNILTTEPEVGTHLPAAVDNLPPTDPIDPGYGGADSIAQYMYNLEHPADLGPGPVDATPDPYTQYSDPYNPDPQAAAPTPDPTPAPDYQQWQSPTVDFPTVEEMMANWVDPTNYNATPDPSSAGTIPIAGSQDNSPQLAADYKQPDYMSLYSAPAQQVVINGPTNPGYGNADSIAQYMWDLEHPTTPTNYGPAPAPVAAPAPAPVAPTPAPAPQQVVISGTPWVPPVANFPTVEEMLANWVDPTNYNAIPDPSSAGTIPITGSKDNSPKLPADYAQPDYMSLYTAPAQQVVIKGPTNPGYGNADSIAQYMWDLEHPAAPTNYGPTPAPAPVAAPAPAPVAPTPAPAPQQVVVAGTPWVPPIANFPTVEEMLANWVDPTNYNAIPDPSSAGTIPITGSKDNSPKLPADYAQPDYMSLYTAPAPAPSAGTIPITGSKSGVKNADEIAQYMWDLEHPVWQDAATWAATPIVATGSKPKTDPTDYSNLGDTPAPIDMSTVPDPVTPGPGPNDPTVTPKPIPIPTPTQAPAAPAFDYQSYNNTLSALAPSQGQAVPSVQDYIAHLGKFDVDKEFGSSQYLHEILNNRG